MTKDRSLTTALHALMALAYNYPELISSNMLATSICTNPAFLRRLISKLVKAKIISSTQGKNGGLCLATDPQNISIKDVYLAIYNENYFKVSDKDPFEECPVSCRAQDVLEDTYSELQVHMLDKMKNTNLKSLIDKIKDEE